MSSFFFRDGKRESHKQKTRPMQYNCRDRNYPAVPPCLTHCVHSFVRIIRRHLLTERPLRLAYSVSLSARPRKSIRLCLYLPHPTAAALLKISTKAYSLFLIGLLYCITAKKLCQVPERHFFNYFHKAYFSGGTIIFRGFSLFYKLYFIYKSVEIRIDL